MVLRRWLRVAIGAACAAVASAHAFLAQPVSRNVLRSDWCPQCFNGPGVCGDPAGSRAREVPGRPTASYRAGGLLKARVVVTANHQGRWSLGLCPRQSSDPKCYTLLSLANSKRKHVYLTGRESSSTAVFRLPRRPPAACRRPAGCVLRWLYETGNSCTPRGTPRRYANPHLAPCGRWIAGERFAGCADVRIR